MSYLPRGAQPRATDLLDVAHLLFDQSFGPLDEAGEHAHTIDQQATVGGMMNGGLHASGIQSQLAAFGDLCLPGEFHHLVVEHVNRLGLQRLLPAEDACWHRARHGRPPDKTSAVLNYP